MSDRLHCNHSRICTLCTAERGGGDVRSRVHITDVELPGPRIAICPVHDIAGPVDLLPDVLRVLVVST